MTDARRYLPWTAPNSEASSAVRDAMRHEQGAVPSQQQLLAMAASVQRALGATGPVGASKAATGGRVAARVAAGVGAVAMIAAVGLVARFVAERAAEGAKSREARTLGAELVAGPMAQRGGGVKEGVETAVAVAVADKVNDNDNVKVNDAGRVNAADRVNDSARGAGGRVRSRVQASPELRGGAPAASAATPGRASAPEAGRNELSMLLRARRAVNAAPDEALSWLGRHAREYPDSAFIEEREALTIEALMAQDKIQLARAHARRFLASFPDSAYRRRIETVLSLKVP